MIPVTKFLGRPAAMPSLAKAKATPQSHVWAIYHLRASPARFIGIIDDAPDEETAIARANEEYKVPMNERGRLLAQRRD